VRTGWLEQVQFLTEFNDDPELECWPALLNQVFMNLLINACQAIAEKQQQSLTKTQGTVAIRLQSKPGSNTVTLCFEDNGIGIDEAVQKRILEPFFTTKAVGSGTGLGLSIAFGIIQKHGGSLTFSSKLGVGSSFTISLPLIKEVESN
jgi:signal transduction histidine kinase